VSRENMKTDLSYSLVAYDFASAVAQDSENGYEGEEGEKFFVHKGFLTALLSVRERINLKLQELLKKKSRAVCFTGHSLGGGLAVLCAFETKFNLRVRGVGVITFGGPKVGSRNFVNLYNMLVPYTLRFVVIRDIIPALRSPAGLQSYFHVGIEIAIDYLGKLVFAPNFIERLILLQFRRHTASNHFMSKYGLAIMIWNICSHLGEYEPDFWLPVKDKILKHCKYIINKLDPVIRATINDQLRAEGVVFKGKNKIHLRDMGVQVDMTAEQQNDTELHFVQSLENIIANFERDGQSQDSDNMPLLQQIRDLKNRYADDAAIV